MPATRDPSRLFVIPTAACLLVLLGTLVAHDYLSRPAQSAQAKAGDALALAQGIADAMPMLVESLINNEDGQAADSAERLRNLVLAARHYAIPEILSPNEIDSLADDPSHFKDRFRLDSLRTRTTTLQRALVMRGTEMLRLAQQQLRSAERLFAVGAFGVLGASLFGWWWALRRQGGAPPATVLALERDGLADALFASSQDSVCVTDCDGHIVKVNAAFTSTTGYSEPEVRGQHLDFNLAPAPAHAEAPDQPFASLMRDGEWQGELWRRRRNGEAYVESTHRRVLRDKDGLVRGILSICRDANVNRDAERLILWQANHDRLTKLPNRGLLFERIGTMLSGSHRGEQGAVMLLDVDRFKNFNDAMGHGIGDQLLIQIAHRLALAVRQGDTVARLDGDRFGVVIAAPVRAGEPERIARALCNQFAEPFQLDGRELFVTVSVGVANFPADGDDVGTLVKRAENALVQVKTRGRNGYHFFEESLNEAAARRLDVEQALRRALAQDQLHLAFQPIIDIHDHRVVTVEALMRWRHPEWGPVSPGEFIPVAEDAGLIVPIGMWLVRTAQDQMDAWERQGLHDFRVSLNISGRQLQTPTQRQELVRQLLSRHPERLTVEITESVLMSDADAVEQFLREVRAAGVVIALDDFGTGYSSLSYLRRFPIDVLKIDKSFVDHMERDAADLALVATIASMGRTLGLTVVAEGVETEGQLRHLKTLGCHVVQGFYYSRPLPAEELSRFMAGDLARMAV